MNKWIKNLIVSKRLGAANKMGELETRVHIGGTFVPLLLSFQSRYAAYRT